MDYSYLPSPVCLEEILLYIRKPYVRYATAATRYITASIDCWNCVVGMVLTSCQRVWEGGRSTGPAMFPSSLR